MERLLYKDLKRWKENPSKKPLILAGARQVGKTWLLKRFGASEYESLAYFNCEKNKALEELLENGFDIHSIIIGLGAISGIEIKPEKTLIVFDEVQEIPSVLASLKYFCESGLGYHIVAAGSLLGLSIHS